MFERFTREARSVVVEAQEQARRFDHGWIGTEHLLLGVLAGGGPGARALRRVGVEPDGIRARLTSEGLDADALAAVGIDLDAVRARVEETFGAGALARGRVPCRRGGRSGAMPFTRNAKRALELALREAIAMGDGFIGPEHVALGAARDIADVAALRAAVVAERRLAS
jgi:ATP-dependent Clp protease ATP-binding subunit ClpA